MKRSEFDVTLRDPAGTTINKRVFAESTDQAGARAIERAKINSKLPLADSQYGAWAVVAAVPASRS